MSARKKYDERCTNCLMKLDLCICSLIPRLDISTKIIVLTSKRESLVPTNTGRLACQALPNSSLLVRGDQDRPYDLRDHVLPGGTVLVLYPSAEATVLDAAFAAAMARPCTLIVPDGNWRQTSKMRRRDSFLAHVPQVTLALGGPSEYGVRNDNKEGGLATIEAIARALGVLESPAIREALEGLMGAMVSRVLKSRGVIRQQTF
jgi:DTW domain-containing protein